jgi:hypothetical protein
VNLLHVMAEVTLTQTPLVQLNRPASYSSEMLLQYKILTQHLKYTVLISLDVIETNGNKVNANIPFEVD